MLYYIAIHLTMPYLTKPHLTMPYLTKPHLIMPYLTKPHLTIKIDEEGYVLFAHAIGSVQLVVNIFISFVTSDGLLKYIV